MSGLKNSAESIEIAPDKEAERHFRPAAADVNGSLLLADRGYEDINYFADLKSNGAFFVIRGKKNIRPIVTGARNAAGVRSSNLKHLVGKPLCHRTLPRQSVDLDVEWVKGDRTVYAGRIVVLYRAGRRNKKDYTYLHTNLDRELFSLEEIGALYRFRWQIELLFREWKQHSNLHRFDTSKTPIAEGLLWASLLAATLQRYVTHSIGRAHSIELSTERACRSTMNYLLDVIRSLLDGSMTRLRNAIESAFRFLRVNTRRAHPKRDRERGRLRAGLQPAGA
jgi:IS4 transposase